VYPRLIVHERLSDLLREIRARTPSGGERTVAIYGKPREEFKDWTTEQLIEEVLKRQREIYRPGADARRDLYDLDDDRLARIASAVAVFVKHHHLMRTDAGWKLASQTFGDAFDLAPEERFRDQPCAGFCSGVLVKPRIIATAAHCILGADDEKRKQQLAQTRVVFGFRMIDATTARTVFDDAQIYTPVELVNQSDRATREDWTLIKLDRDVAGVTPLVLRATGVIGDDAKVGVIGHPCGLPVKYAGGANVRRNDNPEFFRANLDTFGGNSGSPVLADDGPAADLTIEGLLIRGAPDFVRDGDSRNRSLIIPVRDSLDDPPGEDCVRATLFAAWLPR
jgi:V8-like Glu-specific endopeptidase